jgi:Alcohol dehydrogenase GroES-like domain/Alcohol dehydrogenase GroES-associated
MKAVVYQGPFKVAVEDVEDPRIEHPNDVVVRITLSAICGSDLHMYEGRTAAEPRIVFGHENLGIVEEVGAAVASIRQGDRVVMPFNVACGFCKNCVAGVHGVLPDRQPRVRGRRLRLCGHGPLQGRPGRVPARPLRGLQLPEAAPGRRARDRFHPGRRHLPDRLPRLRLGPGVAGRDRGRVWRRAGRPDGRLLRPHPGRLHSVRGRRGARVADEGRGHRRRPDRLPQG